MSRQSSLIDLNVFQEALRKVQQERDYYRSEMAKLRTDYTSLLNENDMLKARLLDIDGEKVIQEAVDAQREACVNCIKLSERKTEIEDAACHASSGDGSFDSPPSVRNDPICCEEPNPRPDTLSMYSKESPLYPFYCGAKGKNLLTLSAERISRCLENLHHISCDSPRFPVEVSRHFLSQIAFESVGGTAKLRVPTSTNRTTMKHLLFGPEHLYFPIKFGSPGLLLSCRKEFMNGSRTWSCFASMRDVKSKPMMYMGDYRLLHVGDLCPEEYNLQLPKAQNRVARVMMDLPNKKRSVQKDKSESKIERQMALQALMDALTTGQEKVRIIAMEFVGYDVDFAENIRARYARPI
ncbi:hypothetical protein BS17DRAFT_881171 [Gyrodon lividus]|nr:hypothetical protein BS17DRAFT_881171 [Gyrodon lividus]